jgi:molecular chaperone GrpE
MTFEETHMMKSKIDPSDREREQIDWEDRYKRLAAELDNTKKRLAKNAAQEIEQARDRVLLDMLPFADNLERFINNYSNYPECTNLIDGVQLTLRSFQRTLEQYHVEPIEALKQSFDPAIHEATASMSYPSLPDGTVIEVIQTGYLRDGRVLRPAKVVVNAA